MTTLKNWIETTLAERDRLEAEEEARAARERQEAIQTQMDRIGAVLDSWGFPREMGSFREDGYYYLPTVPGHNLIFGYGEGYNDKAPGLSYNGCAILSAEAFAVKLRGCGFADKEEAESDPWEDPHRFPAEQ